MNSELKKFATAVKRMRTAQNRYFQERTQEAMREAKYEERHVDECVRWIETAVTALENSDLPEIRRPPRQQQLMQDQANS